MSEPAPNPSPSPAPSPAPAPAPSPAPSEAAQRPDFIPETYWDPQANTLKPEAGEVFKSYQTQAERNAALAARKPEDIKIALPETVKVPEGMEFKIDEKNDPRIPVIREMALKRGWDQDTVNDLIAFDAQQQIAALTAEATRVADENKKLGANADTRKGAVAAWIKAVGLTDAEQKAMVGLAVDAAAISGFEKIMAKAAGTVPGNAPGAPPKPPVQTQEQRWYGNTTPTTSQQKAS